MPCDCYPLRVAMRRFRTLPMRVFPFDCYRLEQCPRRCGVTWRNSGGALARDAAGWNNRRMPGSVVAPFACWPSPITSALVAQAQVNLVDVYLDGDNVCWVEGRPAESGRQVLVCQDAQGRRRELTAAPFSARSRVHEYGGGAVAMAGPVVCFSNFKDQRLYRLDAEGHPVAVTPASPPGATAPALRYADGRIDPSGTRWVGVREQHREAGAPVNAIVAIDLATGGEGLVLVEGHDFYAAPRISPDGTRIAWLAWNHPHMPWAATELWLGQLAGNAVVGATRVAGGTAESVFQPEWSPDNTLYFVTDWSGWWNLHRLDDAGVASNVCPRSAEFGRPQWNLDMSTYAFVSADRLVCSYIENGIGTLAFLDLHSGALTPCDLRFTEFASIRADAGRVAFRGSAPTLATSIVLLDPDSGKSTTVHTATAVVDDPHVRAHLSAPEPVTFKTADDRTAFGLFYPPRHATHRGPIGQLPPLLVRCHGGPTSAATRALDLRTQFWTSRGVAVFDVDYGGSSGYGRAYRDRLHGAWGKVDAQDCAFAVMHLVAGQRVDGSRVVITGSSAGGFTTLSCLTSADPARRALFRAGSSHYGVSDLAALARDTHKFESHYLDWLIGPNPDEGASAYAERSPVHRAANLSVPVAFFQGSDDLVVPPSQTEAMVQALCERGLTALYLLFGGEQHGFRNAMNIQWALDAEFHFFSTLVFGASDAPPTDPA